MRKFMQNRFFNLFRRRVFVAQDMDAIIRTHVANGPFCSIEDRLTYDCWGELIEGVYDPDTRAAQAVRQGGDYPANHITHFSLADGGSLYAFAGGGSIRFAGTRKKHPVVA